MPQVRADAAKQWLEQNVGAVTASRGLGGSGWASFSKYEVCVYLSRACALSIRHMRQMLSLMSLLQVGEQSFFVKTSRKSVEMFAGEAEGLNAMYATQTLRIPKVCLLKYLQHSCYEQKLPVTVKVHALLVLLTSDDALVTRRCIP